MSPVVLVSPPPEATGEARSLRWSRFRQAKTHSAFEVVDRGLGTLALVWQALWILGDRRMWPSATVNYAGVATPVLVVGAWLLLLAVHLLGWRAWWASARGLDVVALGVASAVALTHATATAPPDWGAASAFAVLSAGLAGLLFGARLATSWLLVVVIAECVVILGSPSGVSPLPTDVLYPAYAMTIGLITITARSVLLRDASRADSAAADLERAEQDRLTVEGVDSLLRAQERLLHDTVLNTLTAVLRGGLAASADLADRLRLRCRDSADVLRRLIEAPDDVLPLDPGGRWLDRDLAATLVELYSTGVQLHIDVGPLDRLPAPAYLALRTAAHEALVNVLRHADPANVWLEATAVDDRETSGALVRVRDDGRGFDPAVASTRDGLRGSVFESLAEVGGRARVESHPGGGTLVEMEWPAEVPSVSASAEPPAAGAFALPLLVIFGLFSTAIAVLTREDVNQPVLAALAWVLYIGLGILVAWSALRGPLPWWVVLTVAGVSPLVYQLQTQSAVSTHGPWTDWSSAAIAALFVVVASAGPGYAWLVLLITWLFIQGDIVHELLAEGTALILSAALFGRSTRRNAAAVERARAQEVAERAGESIAEVSVARTRRRYGVLAESKAIGLLDGIATGALNPDDQAVRDAASIEERFIRVIMRVDPARDAMQAFCSVLAVQARRRGIILEVDLADAPPPHIPTPADQLSLSWVVDAADPGSVARLSARVEGSSYVIRLLAPIHAQHRPAAASLPNPGVVLDPDDPDMLWEIRHEMTTGEGG